MRVVIGSDHAGFDQKQRLAQHLRESGIDVTDVGTLNGEDSVDYPDFAIRAARIVAAGDADLGVLVCGTGIGMAIAANKVHGVRAANVTTPEFARLAREHNNANVVTVSAQIRAHAGQRGDRRRVPCHGVRGGAACRSSRQDLGG